MRKQAAALTLGVVSLLTLGAQAEDDATALLLKADELLRTNHGQEAIPLYKQANDAANGKCPECLAGLATAFNQIGAFKAAIEPAQRLVELNASRELTLSGWESLGIAYMKKGDRKSLVAAENALQKSLEISGGAWNEGRYALAIVLLRQDRDAEAMPLLKEFLSRDPRSRIAAHARQILERPICGREECAPEFSLVTTDGEYLTQENLKGKITLFHFWYVTDNWAEQMWPQMSRLALWTKKSGSPVQIVGVTFERDEARARQFMREHGMSWPQCIERRGSSVGEAFHVALYPSQILVNHEGLVVYRSVNWADSRGDELNRAIAIEVDAFKKAQKRQAAAKAQ